MRLNERQLKVLRDLSRRSPAERQPGWKGMTLRSLERRGLIESGMRYRVEAWWRREVNGDRKKEERWFGHEFLYRITDYGRSVLAEIEELRA